MLGVIGCVFRVVNIVCSIRGSVMGGWGGVIQCVTEVVVIWGDVYYLWMTVECQLSPVQIWVYAPRSQCNPVWWCSNLCYVVPIERCCRVVYLFPPSLTHPQIELMALGIKLFETRLLLHSKPASLPSPVRDSWCDITKYKYIRVSQAAWYKCPGRHE